MKQIVLVLLFAVCCISTNVLAQNDAVDPELARLRDDWGMRFFEPEPHMKLAKYFRDKGNQIQAFYILESARRYRFDQETFDAAFLLHFGGFAPLDNSPAEEAKYVALRKSSPNDIKVLEHLADIYISRADYVRGEPLLRTAYEKDPQDYRMLLSLEELYRRLETPEKAAKLIKEFETKYPTSVGGYFFRLSRSEGDLKAVKTLLAEAIEKFPAEGYFWFLRGRQAFLDKDLDEAERSFVKATVLDKNSQRYQAAAASFFRVERKDLTRAIGYYLNLYFLDPHAHFDGFAEAKVSNLNYDISKSLVEKAISEGKRPDDLLHDPNPAVVGVALSKLVEKWESSKTDVFLRMMRHDDVLVRWSAMQALTEKEGIKLDAKINDLLKDNDYRVRGLGAYMAVKLWKDKSFPEMTNLLNERAQVLRFDAVSALLLYGGPAGKRIVAQHKSKEPSEYLRKLIESSLAKDPN